MWEAGCAWKSGEQQGQTKAECGYPTPVYSSSLETETQILTDTTWIEEYTFQSAFQLNANI